MRNAHVRPACSRAWAVAGGVAWQLGGWFLFCRRDQRRFVAYVLDEARVVELTR